MKKLIDYLHLYMGCKIETNITEGHENACMNTEILTPKNYLVIYSALTTQQDNVICKLILRDFKSLTKDELMEFATLTMTPEEINTLTEEDIQDALDQSKTDGLEALDFGDKEADIVFSTVKHFIDRKFDVFGLKEAGLAIYEN